MTADANHPAAAAAAQSDSSPALFRPLTMAGVTLENRIVVSPMCQYVAENGCATDWHLAHLMSFAVSGIGLVMVEATAVEPVGRITHGCLGLYDDACETALGRAIAACRKYGNAKLGIQLGHAGRKGSAHVPWRGGGALGPDDKPWETVSASAIPFAPKWHTPRELDRAGLARIRQAFVDAARRALRLGFDAVEFHSAHGYLMHQFFSPLSNKRQDEYGGSRENRMRFPLECVAAVRDVWPKDRVLGLRISGNDWMEGGATVDDAVAFAEKLKALGVDYVCVSSGGIDPAAKIAVGPGYQVPFAREVKKRTGMTTRAVGMIADPKQAEAIVAGGDADMVALARGLLDDPRWAWHAADVLGAPMRYPPSYDRSHPAVWPGSRIARPGAAGTKKA
jgi:2,4-dienoyl-CoA reductase-like NADH-dependent reductase (Old Yellow Enzyme family)